MSEPSIRRLNPFGVAGLLAVVVAGLVAFVPYAASGEPRGSLLGVLIAIAGVVLGAVGLAAREREAITPVVALALSALAFVVIAWFVVAYAIPTLVLSSFSR
jgi:drug/metabolite transporter (DMT)-like permease